MLLAPRVVHSLIAPLSALFARTVEVAGAADAGLRAALPRRKRLPCTMPILCHAGLEASFLDLFLGFACCFGLVYFGSLSRVLVIIQTRGAFCSMLGQLALGSLRAAAQSGRADVVIYDAPTQSRFKPTPSLQWAEINKNIFAAAF
ncbi:hypothetical protein HGRIS_002765 [Hohenbuehelia grisea]|uniref:Uncharacterized protein n=1 Tax=Hohenbuehelia grisea TaxID=104357 RepID=A0ABR3JLE4_9AGAR